MASQSRTKLHKILKDTSGLERVYFQPPATIKMEYPCIVYSLVSRDTKFADNLPYSNKKRYKIMCMDTDPDSEIADKIATLPYCITETRYTVDNLYHDVLYLYF